MDITLNGRLDTFNTDALFTARDHLTVYLLAEGAVTSEVDFPVDVPDSDKEYTVDFESASDKGEPEAAQAPQATFNIGDTLYYRDRLGRTRQRTAGPRDATLPGDTVIVRSMNRRLHAMRVRGRVTSDNNPSG